MLLRNRDFVLLQLGQLLSTAGTSATAIAYPLLVLAVSHSPAKAGLVAFARLAPVGLFALVAGLAADRWSRKWLMVAADAVRAAAIGGLATAILLGHTAVWVILLVAFVEGAGSTFFDAAQPGALRAVVPRAQLPAAAGAQEARRATVRLAGPPLGGVLYGLDRAVPFLVDAVSYVFSTLSLLMMRTPFQEPRDRDVSPLRSRVGEGFSFLWTQPFLRATALLYIIGNFLGPAILLLIIVVGRRHVLERARVVVVGRADERAPEPGQREDRAPLSGRHDPSIRQFRILHVNVNRIRLEPLPIVQRTLTHLHKIRKIKRRTQLR